MRAVRNTAPAAPHRHCVKVVTFKCLKTFVNSFGIYVQDRIEGICSAQPS